MRGHKDSKSKTCTEVTGVYAANISEEVRAQYPGRSLWLPTWLVSVERRHEGQREVSRGHSKVPTTDPRAKQKTRKGNTPLR